MDEPHLRIFNGWCTATDTKEADQIKKPTNFFILYDGTLYKPSLARPLLHCVTLEMGQKVLEELHEGVCSSHIGGHAFALVAV